MNRWERANAPDAFVFSTDEDERIATELYMLLTQTLGFHLQEKCPGPGQTLWILQRSELTLNLVEHDFFGPDDPTFISADNDQDTQTVAEIAGELLKILQF